MANIVFIGGTGRSGTNILKDILGRHKKVSSFGFEYRFIIDPDGIVDFYNSYSSGWSPNMADVKIKRLEVLLSNIARDSVLSKLFLKVLKPLNKKNGFLSPKKYTGWELERHLPNFSKYSRDLIDKLVEFRYRAIRPGTESYKFFPKMYYSGPKNKEELALIFREFINKLVDGLLKKENKEFFVEDNTWNILFAKEILEIIPNGKIIQVIRDPRDVVSSYIKQRWCPKNVKDAAVYYRDIMERSLEIKSAIPGNNYFEFKFEDFIADPELKIKQVCSFVGLDYDSSMANINLKKSNINRWKKELSEDEQKQMTEILSSVIKKLGYQI